MSNAFQSNRITIFREQYEAISKLPVAIQGKVYKALMDYNFSGSIPKLDGVAQLAFDLIKAGLDVSLSKQRAGQAGGKQKSSRTQAEAKQNASSIEKISIDREDNIVSKYVSRDNSECAHTQSYESVMDDMCVEEDLRPMLWRFIKHCQANGRTLINDKLTDIIMRLDFAYKSDTAQKIKSLKKAIAGGYYDIKEGKGE